MKQNPPGEEYPDLLIRGISSSDYIDSEGRASAALFQFTDNDSERMDGYIEASINWYDDDEALKLTLEQRKKNDEAAHQFKVGAAILARHRIDNLINSPNAKNAMTYERRAIEGNPYHGNLLMKSNLTKSIKTMLAASVAMCVEDIIYRD